MSEPLPYIPHTIIKPGRVLTGSYGTSSWTGLESILADLLDHFRVGRDLALEFGSEHGYSLVALSNFFERVVGVDPFGQQTATDPIEPMVDRCTRNIQQYPNISLIIAPWQLYTQEFDRTHRIATGLDQAYEQAMKIDLIHVDGEHGYYDTFGCGDWACQHAPVVIFHDSISFPDTVMPAIKDLAAKHDRAFYNYDKFHGLGILVDKAHTP
jgi:hypothetical protein